MVGNINTKKIINAMAVALFGMTREEAIKKKVCICCKKSTTELGGINFKEWTISGLCPKCFPKESEEAE
jgi:hypothetical protein